MTEATWGEGTKTPPISWRMSAALESVPRGDDNVAEVTSLEGAVRAWMRLDADHRAAAILSVEHPVQIDGAASQSFAVRASQFLAERLPARAAED